MNQTAQAAPAFDTEETQKSMAINALAENFGKEFSPELLGLWLDLLAPYPVGQVQQAVKNVIERYEFKTLPPFGVLKNALDDLTGTSEKALELQAIAEWGVLNEAIGKFGYYSKPKLHQTTEHVLRLLGGWSAACQWTYTEADFRRKEFIKLWVDSHGRVDVMQLGAGAVQASLSRGKDRSNGPLHIGTTLGALAAGGLRQ